MSLLRLEDVTVALPRGRGAPVPVLDHLNLSVEPGQMLGLVGESGSGKTIASLSVMRLLPPGAKVTGRILLAGPDGETDVNALSEAQMRRMRGRRIGMVFQNPLSALNPMHTVGAQIVEAYRAHTSASYDDAWRHARDLMDEVGIRDPDARLKDYPHQFSGGMRQRVTIAIALACGPGLLIADEPTTGLDPLVARQIMALIARLRREMRMGVLFITHDLSVIEEHADAVHVLYAGRTVEQGPAAAFFAEPRHPYSRALLGSVPRLGQSRLLDIHGSIPEPERRPVGCRFAPRCAFHQPDCDPVYPPPSPGATEAACRHPRAGALDLIEAGSAPMSAVAAAAPRLSVERLAVRYTTGRGRKATFAALDDINLTLGAGECLGVVGESGSGKTTLGRAILQMVSYEGTVTLDGRPFAGLSGAERRARRRRIQVVFQDPRESLNPRMRIFDAVAEPIRLAGTLRGAALRERVGRLLRDVGLDPSLGSRLPRTVSGGQAQRIAIARALAAEPEIIVLDEPTSSLDVSTQATLLNLLKDLGRDRGLSYVLISHDLACVSYLAQRIAVLRGGRLVELADTSSIIASPRDEYTQALVAAAPHLHAPALQRAS
jgi:oligopeptide/dipeptide ABC transporter ATP-binding protein